MSSFAFELGLTTKMPSLFAKAIWLWVWVSGQKKNNSERWWLYWKIPNGCQISLQMIVSKCENIKYWFDNWWINYIITQIQICLKPMNESWMPGKNQFPSIKYPKILMAIILLTNNPSQIFTTYFLNHKSMIKHNSNLFVKQSLSKREAIWINKKRKLRENRPKRKRFRKNEK